MLPAVWTKLTTAWVGFVDGLTRFLKRYLTWFKAP